MSLKGRSWLTTGATQYYLGAKEGLVTIKSSISLTDEQYAFARALVEVGRCASPSAVLQQGVDLLRPHPVSRNSSRTTRRTVSSSSRVVR